MLRFLGGLHHQTARRITGMMATRWEGGEWEYTPVAAALESKGLHPIMDYIRRR